ncbi:dihydroneopterin aldolase [Laspinema sp. D1]|uniref:7,8-dihydroneopterin aldolase n=1 Tax=Laspinema palackyanum D2a TaxID=2953684 RepID=A0ABT2MQ32_9CYAN|nr:dihydroneopterin aldolase [Laspinema sp. D2b]MCT7966090.1 dihydroneopterin aldolase [Laspinema sp. D2a]
MDKSVEQRDAISITGLRYYGYTGYLAEERMLGQWFEVDLTLWVDLLAVGNSDRLEDTLDYRQLVERVRHQIETAKFNTMEHLATQIARSILEWDQAQKIRVRLTKVSPPIPDFSGKISVEITRTPSDFVNS